MKWFEHKDVLSYIIDSYAGVDGRKRQFIWEEKGEILIGNSRAFTDHLNEKFDLHRTNTSWVALHAVLRALGEVVNGYTPRSHVRGGKFKNQEPEVHVLKVLVEREPRCMQCRKPAPEGRCPFGLCSNCCECH
jgi:hypothetical protein